MDLFSLLGQIILGWLFADLLGGIVHWWEDRAGREDMWLLGRAVVTPNRLHHREPLAFAASSLWDRNWTTWAGTALLAAPLFAWWGFSVFLLAATLGGLLSNEVHRAAHKPAAMPRWVTCLQATGFIQSPRHHGQHHAAPQDRSYCVLTGWINPWLDAIGVWARIERGLARLGLPVNRGTK